MANTRQKCTGCGNTYTFEVEDEAKEQGLQIVWECPDFECATRNIIEGTTPAELALDRVNPPADESVRQVTDTDEATSGEKQKS